jgi:hypothetical protein
MGGMLVAIIMIVQLIFMWMLYLRKLVSENTVLVMLPILLGLIVIAFVLPYMIKLKLPGVEAEISKPTQKVPSGHSGGLSLSTRPPSLAVGPR